MLRLQNLAYSCLNYACKPRLLSISINHKLCNHTGICELSSFNKDTIKKYIEQTTNHIALVNDCVKKYDKSLNFSNHDASKLINFAEYESYVAMNNDINLRYSEPTIKLSFKIHDALNPHHPEYWYKICLMPDIRIIEMVCDWVALGIELGKEDKFGGGRGFYEQKARSKYKFTKHQQRLIVSVLNTLERT